MGFTDLKLVKKFIAGGAPPSSSSSHNATQPSATQPQQEHHLDAQGNLPPGYSQPPTTTQNSSIYLNLPTAKEREDMRRREDERRAVEGDGEVGFGRKVGLAVDKIFEFGARGG